MSRPTSRRCAAVLTGALLVAVLVAVGLAGADARAQQGERAPVVRFFAADTSQAGVISLHFFGAQGARVTFYERVGSTRTRLGASRSSTDQTRLLDAVVWRCARLLRRFEARATLPDGRRAVGAYSVRTPSCKTRLALEVPRRVRRGAVGRIRVRDRWSNGAVSPKLCIQAPGDKRRCKTQRLRRAVQVSTRRFRPRTAGRWRIELRFRGHRIKRTIAVGSKAKAAARRPVVLATGDSTLQGVDAILADELGDDAEVVSDLRPGTGISKPFGPWGQLAVEQTRRHRPSITVASIGAVDGFALRDRGGAAHDCCGAGWIAEYTRRVRLMMKSYRRRGSARVIWLTLPIPRGSRAATDAINAAVIGAASRLPEVTVLRMDLFFTPTGYRTSMTYRGRRVRVREVDGKIGRAHV